MSDDLEDAPDWVPLADVLDELGMSLAEFCAAYPHVNVDHVGSDGRAIIDRKEMD